jgi:hypothetical protein
VRKFSGIALQSFLGLLFKEAAEILRFWQGGVNRKGAAITSSPEVTRLNQIRHFIDGAVDTEA